MSEQSSGNTAKLISRIVLGVLLLTALAFGIRSLTRNDIEIRVTKADYDDITSSISTSGKAEPVRNFQAHAGEPGSVQAVFVKNGEQVAAGTLLLRMADAAAQSRVETARSAIAQAQAADFDMRSGGTKDERIGITGDLDRARLQADEAQKSVTALQALQARGAASASEVASAQARLQSAQSSLSTLQQRSTARYSPTDNVRIQAQLADSRASLTAAQQTLASAVVRAPFAGTVYSLPVKAYDFVGAGEELVQVADLSHMQVRAYFDEPEIGKLKMNDPVLIRWDARPSEAWHGRIVRPPTTVITYGTRNVGECLIAVEDATGNLLPNTNVNVNVTTQQIKHVLTIPREALRTQGSDDFVYLVEGNQLVRHDVEVGATNLQKAQILSGLNPGDEVALSALSSSVDLKEGLRVKVQ